jgi:hypothetical protein
MALLQAQDVAGGTVGSLMPDMDDLIRWMQRPRRPNLRWRLCGVTRAELPRSPCAGIYAIYEAGRLSYIGSTQDLRTRIRCHVNSGRFNSMTVKISITSSWEPARVAEGRLIKRLRPAKNRVINVAVERRRVTHGFNVYDYN